MGRDRRRSRARRAQEQRWQQLAATQAGIVTRRQLLGLGLTRGAVDALLDSRRWRGVHPGVYATFTGPLPPIARVWSAVLSAGTDAVAGGATALWLWQVLPELPR